MRTAKSRQISGIAPASPTTAMRVAGSSTKSSSGRTERTASRARVAEIPSRRTSERARDDAPARRLDHVAGLAEPRRENAIERIARARRVAREDARRPNARQRLRRRGDEDALGAERQHRGAAVAIDERPRRGLGRG